MPKAAEVIEIPKFKRKYGEGNIRQRGSRWQFSFYDDDGRRRWQSCSTAEKARKQLNQKLTLKEVGKLDAPVDRGAIDKLAILYLNDRKGGAPKSYSWLLSVWENHLEPYFGGFMAGRITTEKLIAYRNERLKAEASPTTINKELRILHAMYNHALTYTPPKIQRVPSFPKLLKEPPPRAGFLNDEQFDALLGVCPYPGLRALMIIAYTYGFRRSELVGRADRNIPPMSVRQIDLKNMTIDLNPGTTKNEDARTIRMTPEVHEVLRLCVDGKKADDAVFTWEDGSPILDFRGTWAVMCKTTGISFRLHDFRRSATRNLDRAGVSRDVAMKITGHRTDSMYRRYNITSDQDLALAADKLAARRIGGKLVAIAQEADGSSVKY